MSIRIAGLKTQNGRYTGMYFVVATGTALILTVALLCWSGSSSQAQEHTDRTREAVAPRPEATIVGFSNTGLITINDSAGPPTIAAPYPSTITVSGQPASMSNLRVVLNGLAHTFPDDIDIIVVGPQGQRSVLMSDAGGGGDVTLLAPIGFEQSAANPIPDSTTLTAGLFRPANYTDVPNDGFPAPGPTVAVNEPANLDVFNGTNPNGVWSLFIVDDAEVDGGFIATGWSIRFTVPAVTVTKTADTNDGVCDADCSLREAISAASPGETVNFSSLFNSPQTITLGGSELFIDKNLTVQGPGANLLTVSGNSASRVFAIGGGVTVSIKGLAITSGSSTSGGGISNGGNLTVTDAIIAGNTGGSAGGIINNGDLTVARSTITGNTGTSVSGSAGGIFSFNAALNVLDSTIAGNSGETGGGIHCIAGAIVTNSTIAGNYAIGAGAGGINCSDGLLLRNSTISGNTVSGASGAGGVRLGGSGNNSIVNSTITDNSAAGPNSAGGVKKDGANLSLRNTIVAANAINTVIPDVASNVTGPIVSNGYNLIGNRGSESFNQPGDLSGTGVARLDPMLGPLSNNGGPTQTHMLLAGSPALDAGAASGFSTDQRGTTRPADLIGISNVADGSDIGAVEMQPVVVTNDSAADAGSLRQAITDAASGDIVLFDPAFFGVPRTIALGGTELAINKNLTVNGSGPNMLTVSGGNQSRVFSIVGSVVVSLGGMKITGGTTSGTTTVGSGAGIRSSGNLTVSNSTVSGNTAASYGGGIRDGGGTLKVLNSTISGNTALGSGGGGIDSSGVLTVSNSTISGNTAIVGDANGGGIWARTATITNSTITENSASGPGSAGGILRDDGTVGVRNSIIAANFNNGTIPDVAGSGFVSLGFNIIGNRGTETFNQTGDQSGTGASPLNPMLGALSGNGGSTFTHMLLAGSPALDAGNRSGAGADQRGLTRPFDLPGIANVADGADIGAFEAQTSPAARAPFDFDGDGKTDLSIFRPSNGQWWLNRSSDGLIVHTFGNSADRITPADFTGDGRTDVAIFRPSSGEWYVLRSEDSTFYSFPFGTNVDVPVPGDFDGDGKADATVFRNGTWYIQQSAGGTRIEGFGAAGDFPVVADYDGDGRSDIAIYRTSLGQWWLNRSTAGLIVHTFGNSADKPVPGDFTGDAKADVAIWRPSTGEWFVLRSEDSSFYSFPFGTAGDVPAPGDYDGNGIADATVFRPSNATWYSNTQTQGTLINGFGAAADRPAPNAYVP